MKGPAVLLMSGGLDSAVAAYSAKAEHYPLYAVTMFYSQRHSREIQSARDIAQSLNVQSHDIYYVEIPSQSPLVFDKDKVEVPITTSLPTEGRTDRGEPGIPATWVAQRNSIFLSMAFAYAEMVEANYVFAGMNVIDYSGYPDCRPKFLELMAEALNNGSKKFIETGQRIFLETPLVKLTKAQIVSLGAELGVPFEKTWSCYNGKTLACGLCDSCKIRLRGFEEAGLEDPLEYETREVKEGEE